MVKTAKELLEECPFQFSLISIEPLWEHAKKPYVELDIADSYAISLLRIIARLEEKVAKLDIQNDLKTDWLNDIEGKMPEICSLEERLESMDESITRHTMVIRDTQESLESLEEHEATHCSSLSHLEERLEKLEVKNENS